MEADWFCEDKEETRVEIEGECCEVVRELGDTSGIALIAGLNQVWWSSGALRLRVHEPHFPIS